MTKQEFGWWYSSRKVWLQNKARVIISSSTVSYSETDELIAITLEHLLSRVESINPDTLDGYCFIAMKNCFYNNYINPKKWEACCGDFNHVNTADVKYDYDEDKRIASLCDVLEERATTEDAKIILSALREGIPTTSVGLNSYRVKKAYALIRGGQTEDNEGKKFNLRGTSAKYRGIVREDTEGNKKFYPDIRFTKVDGFSPELVRRCITGILKQYKGYVWKIS